MNLFVYFLVSIYAVSVVHGDANNGCDAGSHDEIQECCDANHPCKEGQGDCDHDSECLGNLVCGNGNCDKSKFPSNDTDCCTKECKDYNNFCGTWAARGECEHTPGYMLRNCKESCLQCAELQNTGKDCWYECNRKQGLCSWCGTKGMCCKKGFSDTSNGCDGTFGGSARHECVLKSAASGDWILRSLRSLNETGCSDKDMLKGKMKLETLGVCEDFCKDTRFLQYHESTYCGCFLECDFKRPANEYNSKADVYEQQNFGRTDCPTNPSRNPSTASPPYYGTPYNFPNIINSSDPTSYTGITYAGKGSRRMFDRRNGWMPDVNAYLFTATFSDHSNVEFRCSPEYDYSDAYNQASKYANVLGRIPEIFRSRVDRFDLSPGTQADGGSASGDFGNQMKKEMGGMSLNTGYGARMEAKGFIEEVFIHEGAHASLDGYHVNAREWICAQNDDGKFISTYSRENPGREDVAESAVAWVAVAFRSNRINQHDANTIRRTIPYRIAYFDRKLSVVFPK